MEILKYSGKLFQFRKFHPSVEKKCEVQTYTAASPSTSLDAAPEQATPMLLCLAKYSPKRI